MQLRDGAALKKAMEEQGMSYRRLARYAGCSPSFIAHLTHGRKTTCTPRLAQRIVQGLGIDDLGLLFVVKVSSDTIRSERGQVRRPTQRTPAGQSTDITPVAVSAP